MTGWTASEVPKISARFVFFLSPSSFLKPPCAVLQRAVLVFIQVIL